MESIKGIAIGLTNLEEGYKFPQDKLKVLNQNPSIFCDAIVFTEEKLQDTINSLSKQQGVISTRWLIVDKILGNRDFIAPEDEVIFVQTKYGKEKQFINELSQLNRKQSVLSVRGVYNYVIVMQKEGRNNSLEERLISSQNVRDFVISTVEINNLITFSNNIPEPNLSGRNYLGFNKYEGQSYTNSFGLNLSYFEGCRGIALDIFERCKNLSSTIIYSPLRGARPITDIVMEFLKQYSGERRLPNVLYPVTSSFIRYPLSRHGFSKTKKFPVGGRYSNILELRRLRKHLENFSDMIYIDEIVSGGMITGHTTEMVGKRTYHKSKDGEEGYLDEGILRDLIENQRLNIHVYGLADRNGSKFRDPNRKKLELFEEENLIKFRFFPVRRLVTEDQRYVLGLHYLEYSNGPQSVPMIRNGRYYPVKKEFENDFIKFNTQNGT